MEKKKEAKSDKKGFWSIIKESLDKSNSGCGPGCGCHAEKKDKEVRRKDAPDKPGTGG